jgi:hypothetical protein
VGPGTFVMVLIGCTQGRTCEPVVTLPISYRTESQCIAERAEIVAATEGHGYDRLFAECRKRPIGNRTSAPTRVIAQTPIA